MTTAVQRRRGTNTEHASFTGLEGEISVNTTNESVHVHDGSTAGGFELMRADGSNSSVSLGDITGVTAGTGLSGGGTSGDVTLNIDSTVATLAGTQTFTNKTLTSPILNTPTIGTSFTIGGATITEAELEILDGATVTTTELNYVDGVTSSIQTQIDAKAPLASPTFTGTVTMSGLTVDTDTLYVDSTNNRVGIGTSPLYPFHVQMPSDGSTGAVFRYIGGTNNPGLFFSTNESTTDCVINATGSTSANLVFSTTSERMRIDSSGNVGVGLTDPDEKLEIFGDVKIGQSGGSGVLHFGNASDKTKIIGRDNAHSSLPNTLGIFTDNAERMTFDASGNVGIGTSSPDRPLDITDTTSDGSGGAVIHSYLPTLELDDISGGGTSFILQHDGTSTLFKHDTTERMRIDSSGNVGIGGGTISSKLFINTDTVGDSYFRGGADNSRQLDFSTFATASPNAGHKINATSVNGQIAFATGGTERMRIDSSGNLLVGTTSTPNGGHVLKIASGTVSTVETDVTTVINMIVFRNGNGNVGTIQTNGSTTTYNTSSDQRLKENIADADDAGSKIDAIQVRKFDWKADGSHQDYGMIAQELQTVAPEAVSGDADSEEMMGVDYSKLVPMLIKEIQSLRNRVAQLEE